MNNYKDLESKEYDHLCKMIGHVVLSADDDEMHLYAEMIRHVCLQINMRIPRNVRAYIESFTDLEALVLTNLDTVVNPYPLELRELATASMKEEESIIIDDKRYKIFNAPAHLARFWENSGESREVYKSGLEIKVSDIPPSIEYIRICHTTYFKAYKSYIETMMIERVDNTSMDNTIATLLKVQANPDQPVDLMKENKAVYLYIPRWEVPVDSGTFTWKGEKRDAVTIKVSAIPKNVKYVRFFVHYHQQSII